MTLSKTYTAEDLTNYLWNHDTALLANQNYHIWDSPAGLKLTKGSHEFRDKDHKSIINFRIGDEAPETKGDLKHMMKFQLGQNS